MSKDVVPGPFFEMLQPLTLLGDAWPLIPVPLTEPGEVADLSGNLWLDALGDRLVHGEMAVTLKQAQAAARHGWGAVAGSESNGKVTVRRPDPYPEQD